MRPGPRKTRGPTKLADVWNRTPGQELPENFNHFNQCVDDDELGLFCGTIARNPELTPLEHSDWRTVPPEIKEETWTIVKEVGSGKMIGNLEVSNGLYVLRTGRMDNIPLGDRLSLAH
ncbi:hypothetical protein LINPERPRIM_LOCUS14986, partial [Linum perenne]